MSLPKPYYRIDELVAYLGISDVDDKDLLRWGETGELQFHVLRNEKIVSVTVHLHREYGGGQVDISELNLTGPDIILPVSRSTVSDILMNSHGGSCVKLHPHQSLLERMIDSDSDTSDLKVDYEVKFTRAEALARHEHAQRVGDEEEPWCDWICHKDCLVIVADEANRFKDWLIKPEETVEELSQGLKSKYLRIIGAMVYTKYSDRKFTKETSGNFHYNKIAKSILRDLQNIGVEDFTKMSDQTIGKAISEAVKEIQPRIPKKKISEVTTGSHDS